MNQHDRELSRPFDTPSTEPALLALQEFYDEDRGALPTLIIPPNSALVADPFLRPRHEWGTVRHNLRESIYLPAHVHAHVLGTPEGAVLRGVCSCGARLELLLDERPVFWSLPADTRHLTHNVPDLEIGTQLLVGDWLPAHVHCGSQPRIQLPEALYAAGMAQFARVERALAEGRDVPDCLGVVYRTPTGTGEITALTPMRDLADGDDWETQCMPRLAARQFALRSLAREINAEPLVAFSIGVRRRGHRRYGGSARGVEQWSLSFIATSPTFGFGILTRWRSPRALLNGKGDTAYYVVSEPNEEVDGLLAGAPVPRAAR